MFQPLKFARCAGPTALLAAVGLVALSGCQSAPIAEEPLAPSLELLESGPLVLADDCRATSTVVVEFTVLESGRADRIRTAAAEPCVRQALTAWVGSFRYSPPGTETAESIEWMLVTARKGS